MSTYRSTRCEAFHFGSVSTKNIISNSVETRPSSCRSCSQWHGFRQLDLSNVLQTVPWDHTSATTLYLLENHCEWYLKMQKHSLWNEKTPKTKSQIRYICRDYGKFRFWYPKVKLHVWNASGEFRLGTRDFSNLIQHWIMHIQQEMIK
jgi:hypothetical protein